MTAAPTSSCAGPPTRWPTPRTPRAPPSRPPDLWGDWSAVDLAVQADFDRDGYQDLLNRGLGGELVWTHYQPSSQTWDHRVLATGWGSRKQILAPGDVTGDTLPDLLSLDSANTLWLYPGKGDGYFSGRVQVTTGLTAYDQLRGHGDFTGDGKADMLARAWNGDLYLYAGTGKAGSAFTPGSRCAAGPRSRAWSRPVT